MSTNYEEKYIEYEDQRDRPTNIFKNLPSKHLIVVGMFLMFVLIYYSVTSGIEISPWMIVGVAVVIVILIGMKSQSEQGIISRDQAEAILFKKVQEEQSKEDSEFPDGDVVITPIGKLIEYPPKRWMIGYYIIDKNSRKYEYYGVIDATRGLGYLGSKIMPTGFYGDEGAAEGGYTKHGEGEYEH